MHAKWAWSLGAAIALTVAAIAPSAAATDPVDLGSGFVVDQVGALSSSQAAEVEDRLERLADESPVDLWVVYVDAFTNPSDAEEWANTTADQNGLGPNQYLLAVAVDARQFYLSASSEGPVSLDQVTQIEQQQITPELRADDWAGAAIAAADGLQAAAGGGGAAAGGGGFTGILIFLAIAAAIGLVVWLIVRSRRRKKIASGERPAEELSTAELAQRAASALVQTDDAVRTSEQELGFAKAQFGDAAAAEFDAVLATAKEKLTQAFTLQQQLDDGVEDTEEQTRAWNAQILQLCDEANGLLDEKAAAFDQLRQLEQNAPEALARVTTERDAAADALAAATARLESMGTTYAPEALATVADNPAQSEQRLSFADEQLAAAQSAIAAGDTASAAVGIRAAEEAVGQAVLLETAISTLADDLAKAEAGAKALIAELEGDLVAASALPDPDGRVAGAIATVRQQVDAARANLSGTQTRPLLTYESLEAANTQIDAVISGVRDAQAQRERAQQVLGQQLLQAQAQVSAAEDYITARRGAVGAQARTRLAEAGAALVQAQQLQATAPEQALPLAQRAHQLASQAVQYAQSDVGSFPGQGGGSGGGGGNVMGAVLGGILINSMLGGGGGGRAPSRGGSLGGSFGGGMRPSGGGMRPGSFGGGGTRGRRGGGRF